MEKSQVLSVLRDGSMHLEGQFIYGSNTTFMGVCQFEGGSVKVVYKPIRGEQPLWDFPRQTLARREVAAYLISKALGWELVPPTVFRTKRAPLGPGSVQVYIEHDPEYHYFNFIQKDRGHLPMVMAFDLLINNADRKGGHLIIDTEGKLWLIDHGLSFHVEDKLRTVVWDFAGENVPPNLMSDINSLVPRLSPGESLYKSLHPHLMAVEIAAIQKRAEVLLENGVFPLPPEDRRAYPWPLV